MIENCDECFALNNCYPCDFDGCPNEYTQVYFDRTFYANKERLEALDYEDED